MIPEAKPRLTGLPRPDSSPSSDAASVKPIEMPAPIEAARPTNRVVRVSCVAKAVAKIGASVVAREHVVPGFGGGKIAQQLAGFGIRRTVGGLAVELLGLALHLARLGPHPLESEVLDQPDRVAGVEARDVLAANERYHIAEAAHVRLDQAAAVLVFLHGHFLEHLGRGGILLAQTFGVLPVDPGVVFLVGNGKREHLLLGEVREPPPPCGESGDHPFFPFRTILN